MRYMERKIDAARAESSSTLEEVRHFIGRLAHHVRAPKKVIEDLTTPEIEGFLDFYDVCQISQTPSVARPEADSQTTLRGIIGRMLPRNDPQKEKYEKCLSSMDAKLNLQDRVVLEYGKKAFRPTVHAEVQVLEHFYENRLEFAEKDRYIGCSKPACFCCQLYFRHHPLSCVEPVSHHKVYLKWGPPALLEGDKDPRYKHQRDILNQMAATIRKEVLEQIINKSDPLKYHADSYTGITRSIVSEPPVPRLTSMETRFATLVIGMPSAITQRHADADKIQILPTRARARPRIITGLAPLTILAHRP